MSLVADLGGVVDPHQVVLVYQVLHNEVQQPCSFRQLVQSVWEIIFPTKGGDDGTVEGVHHRQRKHHEDES